MNIAIRIRSCLVFASIMIAALNSYSETVYYTLDNVILADDTQMRGIFLWTYDAGDFENGVGQFSDLYIPYTTHDHTDLTANIDATQSIEITLEGSVHDDGVDITLVLSEPLTPTTSSLLVLGAGESKYEIGGNGFHTGLFKSGQISPTNLTVQLAPATPGFVSISWEPDLSDHVLQETHLIPPSNWTNSNSGNTNPVVVPVSQAAMFYRVVKP